MFVKESASKNILVRAKVKLEKPLCDEAIKMLRIGFYNLANLFGRKGDHHRKHVIQPLQASRIMESNSDAFLKQKRMNYIRAGTVEITTKVNYADKHTYLIRTAIEPKTTETRRRAAD
jgi:hypothetical protein